MCNRLVSRPVEVEQVCEMVLVIAMVIYRPLPSERASLGAKIKLKRRRRRRKEPAISVYVGRCLIKV